MNTKFDLAIVGAGIAGLAHAYHAARRGLKVAVFDRSVRAQGASIRNFGMVWPVGQARGAKYERATRALGHWQTLAKGAGFDLTQTGSLHLAYRSDEWAVLQEFVAEHHDPAQVVSLLSPTETLTRSQWVNPDGLVGSMWSESEHVTTSPVAIRAIPAYLEREYGVQFFWQHAVTRVGTGFVVARDQDFDADRVIVCSGVDFETLLPQAIAQSPMVKCKLQMFSGRMPDPAFALGPCLCAGLTLLHYDAFAACATLPALKARVERELPDTREHGIHILVSQHATGELILGDSHHYGADPQPFDLELVQQIMERELATFTCFTGMQITRRWHGLYAKTPGETEWMSEPAERVHLVNGLGGTGMSLTLGLAEENIDRLYAA